MQLLTALAGRKDTSSLKVMENAVESANTEVRIAALSALSLSGNSETVLLLAKKAAELKGLEKVILNPGEQKTVKFVLKPEHLCLLDSHLESVVEPGTFEVMIGSSSEDIRQKGSFEVID